jgi:predicted GNAT family acetyltransferase
VEVIRHDTAAEFLARAKAWLERAEAENNLILGISRYFEAKPERTNVNPYFLTVEDTGTLIGAALMTPPRHLIIARMPSAALLALADYFFSDSIAVPGVVGPKSTTQLFADHWRNQTGKGSHLKMSQRIYACERVVVQGYSRGHMRPAMDSDKALLVQWSAEFCREAGIEDEIEYTQARIPNEIAKQSLYVWDNHEPVSMAVVQRATACGICVSMVYTPRHLRKRGYATSCVAALTQRMLDSGKKFCCLHTDLTNATSNAIYQKIGYEPVCDSEDLVFE